MDQWITLRCTSSYPLIHSPYCYGVLPHQTKVTEQPAILPKCFWHTGWPRLEDGLGGNYLFPT